MKHWINLTSSQWLLASQLVKVLRPFELATRIMSSEENVSISITLPLMEGLARGLVNDEENLTTISNVKKELKEQLTSLFNLDCLDADSLPVMAALLDSPFKNTKFFTDKEDKEAAKSALLTLRKEQTNKSQVNQQVGDEDVRSPPAK